MAASPRLFLITPRLDEPTAFVPLLETALRSADVACVLSRSVGRDEQGLKAVARALAPVAQRRGAAVLAEAEPRFAIRLELDGVHLHQPGQLREALAALKPDRIVGVGGIETRDAAMAAGEAGVDYLMFGGPDGAEGPGAHDAVCELVAWWSEIFTVPCVGFARRPDLARDIARAGAEFVGLCHGLWDRPQEICDILAEVSARLAPEEVR